MVNRDNPCPDIDTLNNMGNLIRDCAVHEINLALKFKNELPEAVYAIGQKSNKDSHVIDTTYCTLIYSNQQIITIENSRYSPDGYD